MGGGWGAENASRVNHSTNLVLLSLFFVKLPARISQVFHIYPLVVMLTSEQQLETVIESRALFWPESTCLEWNCVPTVSEQSGTLLKQRGLGPLAVV